ncbi:MAG: hypothetical protein LBR53_02980 [Deltaproteobacteria bacterium]|jgi:NitT/TauT family transport system substrate-binding protein|nr:hypothetical protein [Deltaproteobacteria bacterium]
MRKPGYSLPAPLLAGLFLILASPALRAEEAPSPRPEKVVVYTAAAATTAVLPLLTALNEGWPRDAGGGTVEREVSEWKNLDDLRSLLLAGKGDVWAGHLETFARAAARGAPVRLISVCSWRKFYFVSAPLPLEAGAASRVPKNPAELARYLSGNKLPLPAAPRNSPAAGILAALAQKGGPAFSAEGYPGTQLLLELASGRIDAALLPEPLASAALEKNPALKIVGNLEEEYARAAGGPPELPQAGVAVNRDFAREFPELTVSLMDALKSAGKKLQRLSPEELVRLLPESTRENLGLTALENSFSRDPVRVENAADLALDISRFLKIAAPDLFGADDSPSPLPRDFIFRGGDASAPEGL